MFIAEKQKLGCKVTGESFIYNLVVLLNRPVIDLVLPSYIIRSLFRNVL